ncbi:MAG: hypothetical protein JJT89_13800 [Nitriliruptoraceae bacterium]|nr:hypothetical protein [Nitriliruptoraceae bacterium]
MRITSEVMVTRSLDRLQTRLKAYERTQSELGTGKRILKPSDDPAGSRRGMTLRATLQGHERNLANISDGLGWVNAADSQLQSAIDRLSRARELATRGATNSALNERQALAAEIDAIREEIQGIANAKHLDRQLFGGYSDQPAVQSDPVTGAITYSTVAGDEVTRRVSEAELVRVNVTAAEWLGPENDNLLTQLGALANTLRDPASGPADVAPFLDTLKAAHDRIAINLADIGAATNRVESAKNRAESQLLTVRTELSDVEDVDVARGMMELQIQQVGYEATLQALSQALPPSLVAFLR